MLASHFCVWEENFVEVLCSILFLNFPLFFPQVLPFAYFAHVPVFSFQSPLIFAFVLVFLCFFLQLIIFLLQILPSLLFSSFGCHSIF